MKKVFLPILSVISVFLLILTTFSIFKTLLNQKPVNTAQAAGLNLIVNSITDEPDNNLNDGICRTLNGNCTLRAAVQQANQSTDLDTISFNLATSLKNPNSGAVGFDFWTIKPTFALPKIINPVKIDGSSQPGFGSGNLNPGLQPVININIENGNNALELDFGSSNSTIQNLVIYGNNDAIDRIDIDKPERAAIIVTSDNNKITGNYIGLDITGTKIPEESPLKRQSTGLAFAGNLIGISVYGKNNVIGGNSLDERNIISANSSFGILTEGFVQNPFSPNKQTIMAENTQIINNYIGCDFSGEQSILPTANARIYGTGIALGKNNVAQNNLICSVNTGISGNGKIIGNTIGTNKTFNKNFSLKYGIFLRGEGGQVGGDTIESGNMIVNATKAILVEPADDGSVGIILLNTTQSSGGRGGVDENHIIRNNFIGTNKTQTKIMPNQTAIELENTVNKVQIINNVIANNDYGIVQFSQAGNNFSQNTIYNNKNLGIDILEADNSGKFNIYGVNKTGWSNVDSPYLTKAEIKDNQLILEGFSGPLSKNKIEFFLSDNDPTGFGEGKKYLTTLIEASSEDQDTSTGNYSDPLVGNGFSSRKFKFVIPLPNQVNVGSLLTATITTENGVSTSEFGKNILVTGVQTKTIPATNIFYNPGKTRPLLLGIKDLRISADTEEDFVSCSVKVKRSGLPSNWITLQSTVEFGICKAIFPAKSQTSTEWDVQITATDINGNNWQGSDKYRFKGSSFSRVIINAKIL